MDNFYLILVIVLFALAVSDLIVGVSNDAVNFLNSALGSKVAPRYVILIIASLGILMGASFSSGMMEVARKGIFYPEQFYFVEIMTIFLAVMIADVILLDLFNTFGMPTSTTVSIVFELLGAAVAVAALKIYNAGGYMGDFINFEKAIIIISGILLSIVVSFTVGTFIQYITRLIFTFDYEKYLAIYGSIWGATGITAITYFILIKGAKDSAFISPETLDYIKANTFYIIGMSFVCWLVLLQFMLFFTRINILKIIVLVGTFALAMAFAGNDLVNFIGVPLAGFKSYQAFMESPGADPYHFFMSALNGKVKTEGYMLIIAGLVMAVTIWVSKKAKTVTETEINLSRQGEGYERFGSSAFSRNLVRGSISTSNAVRKVVPDFILAKLNGRFNKTSETQPTSDKNKPSFDLLRASVNLVTASVLISIATSWKLPLSTTYVTFMVAMGTSFGDGAWGRESAVYRISGVISVIGGWFLTAFAAFTAAFVFAILIIYGGAFAIIALLAVAIIFVIKTHSLHRKKQSGESTTEIAGKDSELMQSDILQRNSENIIQTLASVSKAYNDTLEGLLEEDRQKLRQSNKDIEDLNVNVQVLKDNIYMTINSLREDFIETGHYHVQVLDYMMEMARCLSYISTPAFNHIDNNHKGLNLVQIEEFQKVRVSIYNLFNDILPRLRELKFDDIQPIIDSQKEIIDYISELNRKQVKRIKQGEAGTKNSLLYFGILSETKNLLLHTISLFKAQRDFIRYNKIL